MQFENMREFVTLSETLNYSEAAETLYMAQSTLSRHIKGMEDELGFPLFSYGNRKVALTQFGSMMLPYAKRAVELQDEYLDFISEYMKTFQEPLYVGVPSSWHSWGLSDCITNFQLEHGNIQINFVVRPNNELTQRINDKEFNLAFIIEEQDSIDDGFNRILFGHEPPLTAVVPEHHPFASRDYVTVQDLEQETLLLMPEDSYPYALTMQMFHEAGLEPKYSVKGVVGKAVFAFVEKNLGIALVADTNDIEEQSTTGKKVPIYPRIGGNINLIYHKNRLTKIEKSFVDFIRAYAEEI